MREGCTQPTQRAHLEYPAWVMGPYRKPTTLGHATNTGNHSNSTYIETNREAAKMRRQRKYMAKMKRQIKTPEKELNKMETSKLLDAEFKTLVIRILKELNVFYHV